jgi:hypothetical protein
MGTIHSWPRGLDSTYGQDGVILPTISIREVDIEDESVLMAKALRERGKNQKIS